MSVLQTRWWLPQLHTAQAWRRSKSFLEARAVNLVVRDPLIPTLGRRNMEDRELKGNFCSIATLRPAWRVPPCLRLSISDSARRRSPVLCEGDGTTAAVPFLSLLLYSGPVWSQQELHSGESQTSQLKSEAWTFQVCPLSSYRQARPMSNSDLRNKRGCFGFWTQYFLYPLSIKERSCTSNYSEGESQSTLRCSRSWFSLSLSLLASPL